jgi:hypothetical protein
VLPRTLKVVTDAVPNIGRLAGKVFTHLRDEVTKLFDANLLGISPKSRTVHLSPLVKGWKEYAQLHGRQLRTPQPVSYAPTVQALRRRWAAFQRSLVARGGERRSRGSVE